MPWIGGAIAAGGSIAGGLIGSSSAKKAAKEQAKATQAAIAEERRQYDQTRADLEPWRNTGASAVNRLGVLMGLSPGHGYSGSLEQSIGDRPQRSDFGGGGGTMMDLFTGGPNRKYELAAAEWDRKKSDYERAAASPEEGYGDLLKKFTLADFWDDPVTQASYQQGLDQGTKALANMAGARGNRNSGAQLKALARFSTDYTGNQAAGSQARFVGDQTNLYNRLAGIGGGGQTAATNTAQFGQNTANTIAGLTTAQGNARGAAAIAGGNALGGAIRNVGNIFGNIFGGNGGGAPNQNYNAAGQFTPYYTGYGAAGDYQYG